MRPQALFDDLAKGLAGGTMSRLEAVRLLGAALFGGALASVPGVALAVPPPGTEPPAGAEPSSSACERYCIRNVPVGPERAQCLSQGAQGSGPCYECNPGLSPAAGPNFPGCPPDQVFDPFAEFGTCCRTCPEDAVVCKSDNGVNEFCVGLDNQCDSTPGAGGTFDPSTCTCTCPPDTTDCAGDSEYAWVHGGGCADLQNDPNNCGRCGYSCQNVSTTAVCVNGVCVESV
jgi:hypothetical protein